MKALKISTFLKNLDFCLIRNVIDTRNEIIDPQVPSDHWFLIYVYTRSFLFFQRFLHIWQIMQITQLYVSVKKITLTLKQKLQKGLFIVFE